MPGWAQTPGPGSTGPLTLDKAIAIGLENHNRIAIARSQQEASAYRVTQTKSSLYPQITPSWRYNFQRSDYDVGLGDGSQRSTQNVTAINLEQVVWDSGRRELNIARSKDGVVASALNVKDARQAVIYDVTSSWYELLRARELVRVAESSAQRAKTTLDATNAFVEAGASPRKDVLQAQADYENAQVDVIQARNRVRLAETGLKIAMGIVSTERIEPSDTPIVTPSDTPDTRTVSDYVALAFDNRPDLKRSEVDIQSTKKSVKLARIDAGPLVQSTVSAGYRAHPDPGDDTSFFTTVTYPLFDAGASKAAVREAEAGLKQAQQSLELSRLDVAAAVESAYIQREEARTRLSAVRAALVASQENYNAATESRQEGVGTILDVITAQNQLVTAETQAVQAIYDFYVADALLQRSVGQNDINLTGASPS